jgi:hypothetical protein
MSSKGVKHLTTRQRERIVELHREGRSTEQIAWDAYCTVHQVRHALKKAGLKPTNGRYGACYRNADLLRRLASEGVSLSEMARLIGSSHSKVHAFLRKHEIPLVPFQQVRENNPSWKGGRMIDKAGYILIRLPDHPGADSHGYVREHRLVMEKMIGRFLQPSEVVHHKDNDPSHNVPWNLELFASNSEHLATTLKGRCPEWTDEGFRRIQERWSRLADERRESTPPERGQDGRWLPGKNYRIPS